MAAPTISSFSLSHAAILDGETAAELADVYGVNEGSLELESDTYERQGDDKILSTARWITKGTLSLKSNYISFDMMEKLYGTAPVVTPADTTDPEAPVPGTSVMPLWTEKAMNVRPRPVLVQAPGEDADGNPLTFKIVLYKVKFGQLSFDQFMSYKEGLAVDFSGDALLSEVDELGVPFEDGLGARIGKIIAVDIV